MDLEKILVEGGPMVFVAVVGIKFYFQQQRFEAKLESELKEKEMDQDAEKKNEKKKESDEYVKVSEFKDHMEKIDLNLNNHITTLQSDVDEIKNTVSDIQECNKELNREMGEVKTALEMMVDNK